MKTHPSNALPAAFAAVGLLLTPSLWAAKELQSAEFTLIKNKVERESGSTLSPVREKDTLAEKTLVDTGNASFTEVKFGDSSMMRLGPNTKLSYVSKDRVIRLDRGSLIVNTPEGNGGITVEGGDMKGTAPGTTIMATRDEQGNFGFLVLEGSQGGQATGKDGVPVPLQPGQMITLRQDGKAAKVVEVHIDALRDFAPLYTDFASKLPGSAGVQGTTDRQAGDIQTEMLFLQSPKEQGLEDSGPEVQALAILAGTSLKEMDASLNILLGDYSTAAGKEESSTSEGDLLAVNEGSMIADAREDGADSILASSLMVSSGDLSQTDTAAGVETAAGGGGGADAQIPGLTTPITFAGTGIGGGTTGGGAGTTGGTTGTTTGATTGGTTGTTTGGTTGTTTGGTTGTPGTTTGGTTGGTTGSTTGGTTGTTTGGTTGTTTGGTTGTTTGGTTGIVPTPPNPNPPPNNSGIPPVFSSPTPGFTTPI